MTFGILLSIIIFKSQKIIKSFENNNHTVSFANGHEFKHSINFNIVETKKKLHEKLQLTNTNFALNHVVTETCRLPFPLPVD